MRELIQQYPELAAVVVLVLGTALGRVAQLLVLRVLAVSDRLVGRYGSRERELFPPVLQQVFSLLVFATVLVMAAVIAVRLLDIAELTAWLDAVLGYVPRFLVGLVIIGVGNVVGALLRNLSAGVVAGGDGSALLPRVVHLGVVAIAVITGLQQMGIDISFVTQLALVGLAALLGALSLAFALGARQHVANLMAQSELSRYATGDRLRIDGDEGVIVEIHRTGLTLTTDEGLVSIPAARLASGRVVQLAHEPGGE